MPLSRGRVAQVVAKRADTSKMPATKRTKGNKQTATDSVSSARSVIDGALDTLGNVIRVMGTESFPLETDIDADRFAVMCSEFARHVENGAAVPSCDIPTAANGSREWGHVRRFFADRRQAEKQFVTEKLQGYRGIVDDLVAGFKDIGLRDLDTESAVLECLTSIEAAVRDGGLSKIKDALARTIQEVGETFAEQKASYEAQLSELNDRISSMRQDLVAVREEMQRDALTQAYNRGGFDAAILQTVNAYFILRQPVTLLMVDIDHFKQFNDTFGHSVGDAVLRATGECLARSFIRKNDLIARYGGDEFAVILPDTTQQQAQRIVERFLDRVRTVNVGGGDSKPVTCSVGYTEITENDTVESFVARADEALYRAKAAGRDRGISIAAHDPVLAGTH